METLPIRALRRRESRLLRAQLRYVAGAPFYRAKFRRAGIAVARIHGPEDLVRLPFTLKDELRRSQEVAPPLGLHRACPRHAVKRVYLTSGTTGTPTFVGLTNRDLKSWIEMASRAYWAAGLRPHHWVVSSLGAGPFIAGVTLEGLRNIGCCLVPIGPARTEQIVTAFQRGRATALSCTPSYATYLLDHCAQQGIEPSSLGIQRMQLGGEPGWYPGFRTRIEAAFRCVPAESLGMGDISVDFWGECEEHLGMHFCGQDYVYPELIDPDTGETIEWREGATGELVYTHLQRECIPLVRFRSRDQARVTSTSCPCGRTTPLIRILGRTDDMFKVKAVTVYPTAVKEVVGEFRPRVTGELEIYLTRPTTQVQAPVRIRVEHGTDPGDLAELATALEEVIHKRLLFRAMVELVPARSLARSEYKTSLVRFLD